MPLVTGPSWKGLGVAVWVRGAKSGFTLEVEDIRYRGQSSHLEKGTRQDPVVFPGDYLSESRLRSQKESFLARGWSGAALTSGLG